MSSKKTLSSRASLKIRSCSICWCRTERSCSLCSRSPRSQKPRVHRDRVTRQITLLNYPWPKESNWCKFSPKVFWTILPWASKIKFKITLIIMATMRPRVFKTSRDSNLFRPTKREIFQILPIRKILLPSTQTPRLDNLWLNTTRFQPQTHSTLLKIPDSLWRDSRMLSSLLSSKKLDSNKLIWPKENHSLIRSKNPWQKQASWTLRTLLRTRTRLWGWPEASRENSHKSF